MLFRQSKERRAALEGFGFAAKAFQLRLKAETIRSGDSEVLTFIKDRELDLVKSFSLGFASGDTLSSGAKAFSQQELDFYVESGLMLKLEDKYVDRFRNRLMFPVKDISGEVIGFVGRRIGDKGPKWLDISESKFYSKHKAVYNIDQAAVQARQKNLFIVVEGCLDVVALAKVGVGIAVAPLGTTLTEAQAKVLRRYASRAILLFDPDSAGKSASLISQKQLRAQGITAAIAVLPEFDPDETIRRVGVRPIMEALQSAAEADF